MYNMATTISNSVFLYVKVAKTVDIKSSHCTHTHTHTPPKDTYEVMDMLTNCIVGIIS